MRPGFPCGLARSIGRATASLSLVALLVGPAAASPASADAAFAEAAGRDLRPLLVKIHADWCVACLQLDTTWTKLERAVGDEARLVVFDVTSRRTLAEASAEAERLGLADYFASHRSQTGSVGLVDGVTRQPLQVWMAEPDPSVYVLALSALPAPRQPEPQSVAGLGEPGHGDRGPAAEPVAALPAVSAAPAGADMARPADSARPADTAAVDGAVPAVELLEISWGPAEAERIAVVAVAGADEPRRLHQGDALGPLVLERIERFGVVFRHGDEEIHRVLTRGRP
ncbi:MAG: thioredoxin domain-containing protein [Myxococcota bacterium]|nr:thioredoxin domain-containing protein [Myxococcota bacterium]